MSRTTPAKYVDAFFRYFAESEFDDSAVRDVTGMESRTFADWARAHM